MSTAETELGRLRIGAEVLRYCRIAATARRHGRAVEELPFSVRLILENLERQRLLTPDAVVCEEDVAKCVRFENHRDAGIALTVARVILPDSSGVPVLQDLAALRDAVAAAAGGKPETVAPKIPVDLVVDHSLQVDRSGSPDALKKNLAIEIERNAERYRFLKWAEQGFPGIGLYPPGSGIIHQLNLERIASIVMRRDTGLGPLAYPDFVLGGDSHTPMVNGIGVLGWGVGGIDAEAAMLGLAYDFPLPEVVGVRLVGELPPGVMTTDLVLHVTQRLRAEKVTAAIAEHFGPGLSALSVPERCTIANMAPEYGATASYFPIDERTLDYVEMTRGSAHRRFVEAYARANALFRDAPAPDPHFSRVIEIDLSAVELSVAGPRRPQDRLAVKAVREDFLRKLALPLAEGGFARGAKPNAARKDEARGLGHGAVVIAAITSCTNTSNPIVMLAAGLLAQKAAALGLTPPPYVKTSLAPGSRVVTRYLEEAGLLAPLEKLGFNLVGYGCTTCAGKSGPLDPKVAAQITDNDLVAAAVLSGNRNFEGRIHKLVRANYIMSPPMVVAYALAGRIDIDIQADPLGRSPDGREVFLADIWPGPKEIAALMDIATRPSLLAEVYATPIDRSGWQNIEAPAGAFYPWDPQSSYLLRPRFFDAGDEGDIPEQIEGVRVLGLFGDSLTTDHISPGGEIPLESAAGQYLVAKGVPQKSFNTYVGRRGNYEVMVRATFANLRIKNRLVPGREGGFSRHFPTDEVGTVYDTAMRYRAEGVPLMVLAGSEYGTGSSRDWAAKGTSLLGVRLVLAKSYERIHRSNLIGMGIVPLLFEPDQDWETLGLDGSETFEFLGLRRGVTRGDKIAVRARNDGHAVSFSASVDVRTENERRMLANGGIAQTVLKHLKAGSAAA